MVRRTDRAASAFAHLPEVDAGLAALALWCDTADAPGDDTYTSGDTIHIGTGFSTLPLREQIGLLGHHVLHIAFQHEARMITMQERFGGTFDPILFNLCADALINSCLIAAQHAIPRPAVTLENTLPPTSTENTQHIQLADWDVEKLFLTFNEANKNDETSNKNKSFKKDIHPTLDSHKKQSTAAEWAVRLKRVRHGAAGTGRGIGSVLGQLADFSTSTIPWEVHLRGLLVKALMPSERRSYKRPRAAWIAAEAQARISGTACPVFEPATDRQRFQPRIAVALDTSGSINRHTMTLFAGEIVGIAAKTNAEIHVLCFDDGIYAHHQTSLTETRSLLENIEFRQGGGTTYEGIFNTSDTIEASVLVVLTDMEAHIDAPPQAPVIWTTPKAPRSTPPFGKLVHLCD
ncbi:MAG: VWA-like domain-containing protein [Roseobacter sp.]